MYFSLVNYFVILAEPAFSLLNNVVISLKKYIEIYHTVHGKKSDFVKLNVTILEATLCFFKKT